MLESNGGCRYLVLEDHVGFCSKLSCICRCFNCEHNSYCNWFTDCSSLDWRKVCNASSYYLRASEKLERIILDLIKRIPTRELAGGLLSRREEGLLRALSFAQGDIVEALRVQEHLRYEDDLSASDIRITEKTNELCNLIVFQNSLDDNRRRLENRDLLIYVTPEGLEYLSKLAEDPVGCLKRISTQMTKLKTDNTPEKFSLEQIVLQAWSREMTEAIRWTSLNNIPLQISNIRHDRNVKDILGHIAELGEAMKKDEPIRLEKRECYDLSFDLYNSLALVGRVVYEWSAPIRRLLKDMESSSLSLNLALGKNLNIEGWDQVVVEAYMRNMSEDYLFDLETQQIPYWQMDVQEKSFWGSAAFLAFLWKNREILCDRFAKKLALKEKLRNQMIDHGVRILRHGLSTPLGDVDFFCSKDCRYFVIETDDYEPPYENSYVSSEAFEKRKKLLISHFKNFQSKARWLYPTIERTVMKSPIVFLFVTRFTEVPFCVEATASELESIFGPSRLLDRRETLPTIKLEKGNIRAEVMGREIYDYSPISEHMLSGYFNDKS